MPILRPRRALAGLLLVVFAAALTACAGEGRQLAQAISDENHEAGSDENYAAPLAGETPGDPFEAANRAALERNLAVYDNVVGPAVEGYRASFPEVLRQGLSNVLDNLATPRIFINDLLQAEWERAAVSFARLAFNTTIGFGGLFDRASQMGLERHDEDFGQTLAVWGVEGEPYLMLPVWGPSNPRDATGRVVDMALDPANYLLFPISFVANVTAQTLDGYARDPERLAVMRRESFDFYTTLRDAYDQNRAHEIRNGAPPPAEAEREEFDALFSDAFEAEAHEPSAAQGSPPHVAVHSGFPLVLP